MANHLPSAVAVLPVDPESGRIASGPKLYPPTGEPGPHRAEQPFAKPHGVSLTPSGSIVLVHDKGVDCIFSFHLDRTTGALTPTSQRRV